MSKLYQVHEDDLSELECTLPKLCDKLFDRMDAQTRTQIRRVQKILSDVRWDYGPPCNVRTIPVEDDLEPSDDPAN